MASPNPLMSWSQPKKPTSGPPPCSPWRKAKRKSAFIIPRSRFPVSYWNSTFPSHHCPPTALPGNHSGDHVILSSTPKGVCNLDIVPYKDGSSKATAFCGLISCAEWSSGGNPVASPWRSGKSGLYATPCSGWPGRVRMYGW